MATCLLDFQVGQTQALAEGRGIEELALIEAPLLVEEGAKLGMTDIVLEDIAMATIELEVGARKTLVADDTKLEGVAMLLNET